MWKNCKVSCRICQPGRLYFSEYKDKKLTSKLFYVLFFQDLPHQLNHPVLQLDQPPVLLQKEQPNQHIQGQVNQQLIHELKQNTEVSKSNVSFSI